MKIIYIVFGGREKDQLKRKGVKKVRGCTPPLTEDFRESGKTADIWSIKLLGLRINLIARMAHSPASTGSHCSCFSLWALIGLDFLLWPHSQTPCHHLDPCVCFEFWHFPSDCVAFPLAPGLCNCRQEEPLSLSSPCLPLLPGRQHPSYRSRREESH